MELMANEEMPRVNKAKGVTLSETTRWWSFESAR